MSCARGEPVRDDLEQGTRRLWIAALVVCVSVLQAERLPIQVYSTTDGLAQSTIHRIHRDRRGFLWFGTSEGLSHYDGYEFTTYREASRSRQRRIRTVIDARDGSVWVGTSDGVCLVKPITEPSSPTFECAKPLDRDEIRVHTLHEDRDGGMLVGTDAGLYRMERTPAPAFSPIPLGTAAPSVWAIQRDRSGALWVAASNGLHRLQTDKPSAHLTRRDGLPSDEVLALESDPAGNIWVGTAEGLCLVRSAVARPVVERIFTMKDGLPAIAVKAVHIGMQDTLWVGTTSGIAEAVRDTEGRIVRFRAYAQQHGLSHLDIDTMEDDLAGNLWIGSQSGGAMKLTRGGFVSYGVNDGLGSPYVMAMMETRAGQICAMTRVPGKFYLNFLDGDRFRAVQVPVDSSYYSSRWSGWHQVAAETAGGRWWIASERGLLLFPPGWRDAAARPSEIFNRRKGLIDDHIYQIFEDSQGGIWVGTRYQAAGIARWDPKARTFHQFSASDGLPPVEDARPNGFGEDSHGQIWIGWWRTGVLRYAAGKFQFFGAKDGVPAGGIRRVFTDRRGRVWLGSGGGGVARVDNPTAVKPVFRTYGPAEGLSAAEIQSVTEDSYGRIYIGHGLGVDRIDPDASGPLHVRRFTTLDGLVGGEQQTAIRDHNGVLWFGSVQGVSRLVPAPDLSRPAPAAYITGVKLNGHAVAPGSKLGSLHGSRDQLQIEFTSPRFAPGEIIQYQYRLSERDEWSVPSTQRSVQYAELPAGAHRFEVRAVNSEGAMSPTSATLVFDVIPPFWRRWWFLALCAATIAAVVWALHRADLRRRLDVQAVRMRIARDLHDQVGSGLSQIAILSEVAQRTPDKTPVSQIAEISRELVDSISDIVWAINPARDNLPDLAQRMHRFAADLLTARNVAVEFQAEGLGESTSISPETRRQVYLIYRECVRNALRHSDCHRVKVSVSRKDGALLLEVADDGVGFDRNSATQGTGLASLEERARALGGRIEWLNGSGTTVTLRVPLSV